MSLRNTKNNKFEKIKTLIKNSKFKGVNLTFSKQIVIIGSIMGIISLFMPWIIQKNEYSWNSFNSITGNIGFLLIIIYLLSIFVSISTSYKEKIKLYSDLSIKNHFILITSGVFIISFSVIILGFVSGLHTFFDNTVYGKGIILSMISGIMIFVGGLMVRKEYYSESSEIILNKLNQNRENIKEEDNMKLPF